MTCNFHFLSNTRKLEARDSDIREAKLALREKQEELSEMILRKELAEKRLATQQHEHELNTGKLKRNLEEVTTQLKRKVCRDRIYYVLF